MGGRVGDIEGALLGGNTGAIVGAIDGIIDGDLDGDDVGAKDGAFVGANEGDFVGDSIHDPGHHILTRSFINMFVHVSLIFDCVASMILLSIKSYEIVHESCS